MARMNIRISGLGGQGAVTAAHLLAMAANRASFGYGGQSGRKVLYFESILWSRKENGAR